MQFFLTYDKKSVAIRAISGLWNLNKKQIEPGCYLIHEGRVDGVCSRMRTCKTFVNSFACNLDKAARILAEFLALEYPLNKK